MGSRVQTFVVRIYRRCGLEREVAGVVEIVNSGRRRSFGKFDELRAILSEPASGSRKRAPPCDGTG